MDNNPSLESELSKSEQLSLELPNSSDKEASSRPCSSDENIQFDDGFKSYFKPFSQIINNLTK